MCVGGMAHVSPICATLVPRMGLRRDAGRARERSEERVVVCIRGAFGNMQSRQERMDLGRWVGPVKTPPTGRNSCRLTDDSWMLVVGDSDFECLSVLQEHEQDVKMVQWHPNEEVLSSEEIFLFSMARIKSPWLRSPHYYFSAAPRQCVVRRHDEDMA